jgi:hypothetical protein
MASLLLLTVLSQYTMTRSDTNAVFAAVICVNSHCSDLLLLPGQCAPGSLPCTLFHHLPWYGPHRHGGLWGTAQALRDTHAGLLCGR